MSISAHLVCPARNLSIGLGKPLRDSQKRVLSFADANEGEHSPLTRALWKFLADTSGEDLMVKFSDEEDFETVAGYCEIGGWEEDGDIPFEKYLDPDFSLPSNPGWR